jgi:hypothetical protein
MELLESVEVTTFELAARRSGFGPPTNVKSKTPNRSRSGLNFEFTIAGLTGAQRHRQLARAQLHNSRHQPSQAGPARDAQGHFDELSTLLDRQRLRCVTEPQRLKCNRHSPHSWMKEGSHITVILLSYASRVGNGIRTVPMSLLAAMDLSEG